VVAGALPLDQLDFLALGVTVPPSRVQMTPVLTFALSADSAS
jgi:hypothetical protein